MVHFVVRAALLAGLGCASLSVAAPAGTGGVDGAWFASNLYPILEKAQCRQCHQDTGVASRSRLQFPAEDAGKPEVEAFGYRLAALVSPGDGAGSLLARKPTRRIAHTGGERIKQGSADEEQLLAWVKYLASLSKDEIAAAIARAGVVQAKAPVTVRRLTHSQYNNTVRDLLGDFTKPASAFPPEDFVNGFRNQMEGQGISPLLAEAYNRAAERIARAAFNGGDRRGLIPCKPAGFHDAACRDRFLHEFGQKALRRPLNARETALYGRLFDRQAAAAKSFPEGARIVVEAMLQSPQFLFYARPPGAERDGWETASRLSYFLWDTMPDAELMRAAQAGELSTETGIEKQARRMLADDRARIAMDEFLAQWLRFDRIASAVRERNLYPEFSPELAAAMTEETRRLFRHLAWGDGGAFTEFYNARYSFVNTALAQVYGLDAPAEEFGRVDFPTGSRRAGIVGQATFLTLTSKPGDTSPTERGLFVREHFLCQTVPPPPPGVNATLPPVTDEKPMTNRQRLSVHLSSDACSGCHRLIDPIGFGLEQFDAIGRFRDQHLIKIFPTADELKTKRKTKPTEYLLDIEPQGHIQGLKGTEFGSAAELADVLAKDLGCQQCVVKQLFRYALGRHETAADRPAIEEAFTRFQNTQFRFRELIIAVVTSRPFLGGPS